MTPEGKVQKHLMAEAKKRGALVRKLSYEGRKNATDLLLVFPGNNIYFVETKAPGEKPRASQVLEHKRLMSRGAKVYVVGTTEAADEFIRSVENEIQKT